MADPPPPSIDWNKGTHSSLVSIGTHALYASVSGPDRTTASSPVVILIHGLTSTMSEYPATRRAIASFTRVLDYERAGFGLSDPSPNPPTAVNIATELNALLAATNITPPYITVGHSWGGVLSMEFMDSRRHLSSTSTSPSSKGDLSDDIAGMIFIDASVPTHWLHLPMLWRHPSHSALHTGLDFATATNIRTHSALTPTERSAMLTEEASPKHLSQALLEDAAFEPSYPAVAAKHLLENDPPILRNKPVCVIRGNTDADYEKMYKAGVERGNGTEEQRKAYRAVLDGFREKDIKLQKGFLALSTRGKFMQAPYETSGHSVQITDPGVIAEGVRWVLGELGN